MHIFPLKNTTPNNLERDIISNKFKHFIHKTRKHTKDTKFKLFIEKNSPFFPLFVHLCTKIYNLIPYFGCLRGERTLLIISTDPFQFSRLTKHEMVEYIDE